MMPLKSILKNKILLQKHSHLQECSIDKWPYFILEENIKILNEITEEEEKQRKKDEEKQKSSTPNFNPSSYMNDMNRMSNKFKR